MNNEIENLPYALTPEQEVELEKAIEETYHEENLISHEEALKELSRWINTEGGGDNELVTG